MKFSIIVLLSQIFFSQGIKLSSNDSDLDDEISKIIVNSAEDFIITKPKPEEKEKPKEKLTAFQIVESRPTKTSKEADHNTIVRKQGELKTLLENTKMENLVEKVLSRRDGLSHLLISDVNQLLTEIQTDFPEIAKVYSIGHTTVGNDIYVLELSLNPPTKKDAMFLELDEGAEEDPEKQEMVQKPAILMTAATHARELISTTTNLYEALKLIKQGYLEKDNTMQSLLQKNRYYFLPVLNVDGLQFIEKHWKETGKFARKRKNENHSNGPCDGEFVKGEDVGVDINRNFGVDFGEVEDIDGYKYNLANNEQKALAQKNQNKDPCGYSYQGEMPFSEPETQAYRDFVLSKQENGLSFVINMHSNGDAFIYPFNGRNENDIEKRRPGILEIYKKISNEAPFAKGTQKGTAKQLMGITIGGDQDDWTLATTGIPSATSEIGNVHEFIDEWQVRDAQTATKIANNQSPWLEYIFSNLSEYQKVIQANKGKGTDGQALNDHVAIKIEETPKVELTEAEQKQQDYRNEIQKIIDSSDVQMKLEDSDIIISRQ